MRVKIGKYKSWVGPYQLAELLCFWARDVEDEYGFKRKPDWVHNFGEWLAHGSVEPDPKPGDTSSLLREDRPMTALYKLLTWIDGGRKRDIKIKIDPWDTWSMDHTLALIILPMLRQLRNDKHGAPCVDPKDVPENLRPTRKEISAFNKNGATDSKFFERWDWIMGEMIFAFEHLIDDEWESKFLIGEYDLQSRVSDWDADGKPLMYEMIEGPNHTAKMDHDGLKLVYDRIDRGLLFFGKYYRSLWD